MNFEEIKRYYNEQREEIAYRVASPIVMGTGLITWIYDLFKQDSEQFLIGVGLFSAGQLIRKRNEYVTGRFNELEAKISELEEKVKN